ncbi:MAG: hydrogenase maturation peptidase HycI [Methanobrevibacter sp.]|nr:hydrogenase maturation peptidase HycI [Methanobrevibacter sp.]
MKLKDFLKNYDKLIILGIGNELRGDDALGPYIINLIENELEISFSVDDIDNFTTKNNIILIDGGSAPENFTGLIKKEKPSHLLIIDAALMDSNPGTIKCINENEIANINASTHSMSLSYLIRYLKNDFDFELLFIGIEPFSMNLGEELSPVIVKKANSIKEIIIPYLN